MSALHTWIVLVRGINVGGRVLPMKRLVELMEKAGCSDVRTYIQSGNAVCTSKTSDPEVLAQKIGKAILASEGYEPRVMILSREAFDAAIEANPYPVDDPKLTHVFFLDAAPTAENLAKLDSVKTKTEQYTLDGTSFYLHAPDGFGTSKLAGSFEKLAKVAATARNWRTVTALQALAASSDAAPAPKKLSPSRGTGRSARSKPASSRSPGRRKTRR